MKRKFLLSVLSLSLFATATVGALTATNGVTAMAADAGLSATYVTTDTETGSYWSDTYGKEGYVVFNGKVDGEGTDKNYPKLYSDMYDIAGKSGTELITTGNYVSKKYAVDASDTTKIDADAPISQWAVAAQLLNSYTNNDANKTRSLYAPGSTETYSVARYNTANYFGNEAVIAFSVDVDTPILFTVYLFDWNQKATADMPIRASLYSGFKTVFNCYGNYAKDDNADATIDESVANNYGATPLATTNVTSIAGTYVTFRIEGAGDYSFVAYNPTKGTAANTGTPLPNVNGFFFDAVAKDPVFDGGKSVTLDGTIGLNFYADFAGVRNASEYSVDFEIGERSVTVPFADAVNAGNDRYYFTCPVAAKQMNDQVSATLKKGDEVVSTSTGSIAEYAKANLTSENEKLKALCEALLTYGGYAQTYFDYDVENLANKDVTDGVAAWGETVINASAGTTAGTMPTAMKKSFITTMVLESKTAIRFYFAADSLEGLTFTSGGQTLTPVAVSAGTSADKAGYTHYVEVEVDATQLDDAISVTVDGYTVSYSAMVYAKNVLASDGAGEGLKNLMKALYLYNVAADAYFAK